MVCCRGNGLSVFVKGEDVSMRSRRCCSVSVGARWEVCDLMLRCGLREGWVFCGRWVLWLTRGCWSHGLASFGHQYAQGSVPMRL